MARAPEEGRQVQPRAHAPGTKSDAVRSRLSSSGRSRVHGGRSAAQRRSVLQQADQLSLERRPASFADRGAVELDHAHPVNDTPADLLPNFGNYLNSQGKQRAPEPVRRMRGQGKVYLEDTQRLGSSLEKPGSRSRARWARTRTRAAHLRSPKSKRARLPH